MVNTQRWWRGIIYALVLVAIVTGWALWQTQLSLNNLKKWQLTAAAKHARQARVVTKFWRILSFNQADMVSWDTSLALVEQGTELVIDLQAQIISNFNDTAVAPTTNEIAEMSNRLETIQQLLDQLSNSLNKPTLINRFVSSKQRADLDVAKTGFATLAQLLQGTHRYLILLQNSNELRATGGFVGSYGKLTISNGQVIEFVVQDIYVPDGQFTGFVEAPTGVETYLSSGKGLRLPDANWWPDFPISAQTMLNYFALGDEKDLSGVIAINLDVAETILDVTGPLELPDYNLTVTANTLSDIADVHRTDFFAGSQQKQHFLSILFNQLLFRAQSLSGDQQTKLMATLVERVRHKDIQFFSLNPELETKYQKLGVAGQLTLSPTVPSLTITTLPDALNTTTADVYLMSVETNVGINKANQLIDRDVSFDSDETHSSFRLKLVNRNLPPEQGQITTSTATVAPHLGYVNYHRVLVKPDFMVKNITTGDKAIEKWDEEIIVTQEGEQMKQIGFLVTVPEQATQQVVIQFTHPPLPTKPTIFIQKQSGVGAVPYGVSNRGQKTDFTLSQDTLLQL